jgi:hypothetical protein
VKEGGREKERERETFRRWQRVRKSIAEEAEEAMEAAGWEEDILTVVMRIW